MNRVRPYYTISVVDAMMYIQYGNQHTLCEI